MKKIIIYITFFTCATHAYTQPLPDSVAAKYKMAKSDDEKAIYLNTYLSKLNISDNSAAADLLNLSSWFKTQHDELGADYCDLRLSYILVAKGDFSAALNICFPILTRFEKRNDKAGIRTSYRAISNAYFLSKDYLQAAAYSKKILALIPDSADAMLTSLYNSLGCIYGEAGMPDSGMIYAQKAVNMDMEMKNYQKLALSISTLAENYIAAKEYDIALPFLHKSLDYYKSGKAEIKPYLFAYLMNDFSQVYLGKQSYDSAVYYSNKALEFAVPAYKDQSMRAYEYLYKSFEATNKQDSVNKYFRLAMTTKDSLFSIEKMKSVQALSFREELRQQELETEKIKTEEERRQNIQYVLIALGIVSFIILFFLLSHTIIVTERWISFFGILVLLIVFEFINLVIHPFVERVTHHSPFLMLIALVAIASLLIPLHHRMEKWISVKMTEKNKKIRLENAKKTIEKLEAELNS